MKKIDIFGLQLYAMRTPRGSFKYMVMVVLVQSATVIIQSEEMVLFVQLFLSNSTKKGTEKSVPFFYFPAGTMCT